jgi:hypothetical protein
VCYAVLDGIFDRHPTLEQAAGLPYLRNTGFCYKHVMAGVPYGRPYPAPFAVR